MNRIEMKRYPNFMTSKLGKYNLIQRLACSAVY